MGIDFRFYLNRQGIQGKRGQRGEQGFSPLISVKTQTANEYVLTVQNEDGSFDTPNLRGNAIANTGGTYIRYNPVTGEMYTHDADYATTTQAGVVLLSTYAQLAAGGSEDLIPTSADVYDLVQAQMASIGQGYVTQTEFDNYTAATALTLNGIAGDISALDTGKMSFTDLVSSLVQGNNITLVADAENKTITINAAGTDLSNYVDKTTDQTIDGFKTFLKSPILKGVNNSTISFKDGNNDNEVGKLAYVFADNAMTLKSSGKLYLDTALNTGANAIDVDTLLTSASLANYVTTNTTQNISGTKTFTADLNLQETSPCINFKAGAGNTMGYVRFDSTGTTMRVHSYGNMYLETSQHSGANAINVDDILTSSGLTNVVTTNTAQDISGRKTFLGEKAIYFKQNEIKNKLGFTLYDPSDTELGALEFRPNTIAGGALLNVNVPYDGSNYVGFRYWGHDTVNIVAPKVKKGGTYYIPAKFTDGTNTVTASNDGTVDITSLLPDVSDMATQTWVNNAIQAELGNITTLLNNINSGSGS